MVDSWVEKRLGKGLCAVGRRWGHEMVQHARMRVKEEVRGFGSQIRIAGKTLIRFDALSSFLFSLFSLA
jgi:hypothetical protein